MGVVADFPVSMQTTYMTMPAMEPYYIQNANGSVSGPYYGAPPSGWMPVNVGVPVAAVPQENDIVASKKASKKKLSKKQAKSKSCCRVARVTRQLLHLLF